MGTIIKSSRYRMISNRSFELPLPIKYEVFREDNPVAEYEISAEGKVNCRILTKFKEEMLTPIYRPMDISDIYYFMSSRVFQDNTPFTYSELSLLGLEKYNVYDILRKTRGITPYDCYWLKFEGDSCCNYDEALKTFNLLMTPKDIPAPVMMYMPQQMPEAAGNVDVNEILNQHKVDVGTKIDEKQAAANEPETSSGSVMSPDEIEALFASAGLSDSAPAPEPEPASGGKMSQDDIEKLLASAGVGEPAPAPEPEPASGGKMSQDDIEKLLASAGVGEPAPEPEPETSSGGKLSQEEIEALLSGMANDAKK